MAFPEPLHEDLLTMDQHFWSLMNELANESNSAVSFAQSNKLVLAATVKAPEDASMSPQSSSPPSSPTSQASPSAGYATSPSQHRNTSFAFDGPRISSPASATLPLPMPVTAQTHSEPADLGRITHAKSGGKRRRKQAKAKAKVTKQGVKLKPKTVQGQCLACLGIKQLEERSNRDNTDKFLICNSCRKSHLSLIIASYETELAALGGVRTADAKRAAVKATRKRLSACNNGSDPDNRTFRLLNFHADCELKTIPVTVICDRHIDSMQDFAKELLPASDAGAGAADDCLLLEGFKLMGKTYWLRDAHVPLMDHVDFCFALKKRIVDFLNAEMLTALNNIVEFREALQQSVFLQTTFDIELQDVRLLFAH
eukprot:TRINITY_DN12494_c0_g1_i10.p2 TRINITY_DN12494_c0_g1~~TRINITY_DN12494_c0_g1_i10.p2  ORF type:complete len:369 (+),score=62.09 TRINITY_DN12494_c0_g1_i10:255-1361(+)